MDVVLLERVEKLGQMGDVVAVKDGFARNYLLPQKKALRATKENVSLFESRRVQLVADSLKKRGEAEAVGAKLDGQAFVCVRQASETGNLYGSVTNRDIAEALTSGGLKVQRDQIAIDKPLKELGLHTVRIRLHPEYSVNVTVNIARSEDEAERQARGENVLTRTDEEIQAAEALAVAEEFFERPELAHRDDAQNAQTEDTGGEASKAN